MSALTKAALIRALRTFLEVLSVAIGTGAVRLTSVDWLDAFNLAAGAAVVALILAFYKGLPEAKD